MSDWFRQTTDEVTSRLETDEASGLSTNVARQRLEQYGHNELTERGLKSPWAIIWEQLTEIMVVVLIIAAVVSAFLGETTDAIVILAIVVLNTVLGFSQEYRAERAIAALKQLAVPTVRVKRDGRIEEISAREMVPGDIAMLEAGNKVSADGRLVESVNLSVEEAALTGESEPVEKHTSPIRDEHPPLGDQNNMVFMGTHVTYGRGTMVVTETGMNTQLGKIADMIQDVEREPTPLQRRLESLGKSLALVALAIIAVVVLLGWIRGEELKTLFLTGISMAVAAVPEGLPAVVTITLALGSQRMLKRNALIRKLPAVETLGSVTTICSDKTGTLTENRMTVTVLDVVGEKLSVDAVLEKGIPISRRDAPSAHDLPPEQRSLALLTRAMALANDAVLQPDEDNPEQKRTIGDPTEGALVVAAAEMGVRKVVLEETRPRVAEVPFTSERKRMTTIHEVSDGLDESKAALPDEDVNYVAYSKGAVDSLLEVSNRVWLGDRPAPIDEEMVERINKANAAMAANGQRVLGVAFKPLSELPEPGEEEEVESELIIIGLVGMLDPPRPEVQEAVEKCRTAGIRPVMITGDHPLTAQHIARELRIAGPQSGVITGRDLAHMSIPELEGKVKDIPVYARVSPEHKLNIVTALQDLGEVVAMTGDGVNDAPALKKADIGVAMGITGTDVSKEAADMVLLDDNFATIVSAVEEGRVIFDNIRKFIRYTLSSNTGEIWVMLAAPFLGMPLPLLPLQILWINLVTDGVPGLALAIEPAERGIMERKPFHPNESIFSRGLGWQIIWIGILMGMVSLLMGYWKWIGGGPAGLSGADLDYMRTMVFTTLTMAQMGNALALRSNRDSIFTIGLLSNKPMIGAVLATFLLQLALIYVPFLQEIFETQPLTLRDLAAALVVSTIVFFVVEIDKWRRRRQEALA